MIKEIKLKKFNGELAHGIVELIDNPDGLADRQISLTLRFSGIEIQKVDYDYFSALQQIRIDLEAIKINVLCNGASLDVYPSGMMRDMGGALKAYRLKRGLHAHLSDVVDIFEFDENNFIICTVSEQNEFYEKWKESKKVRRGDAFLKYNKDWLTTESKNKPLEYIYFWGHQPSKDKTITESCLSQWWPCKFEEKNEVYFSAEQWMMAEKARLFNDGDALKKILKTFDNKEIKKIGREIKGFNEELWRFERSSIVKKGNLLKFSQNKDLKKYLISTEEKILVEASPYDEIWGVGLSRNDKKIRLPDNWKGLNLLGFILMEVRDELRNIT